MHRVSYGCCYTYIAYQMGVNTCIPYQMGVQNRISKCPTTLIHDASFIYPKNLS